MTILKGRGRRANPIASTNPKPTSHQLTGRPSAGSAAQSAAMMNPTRAHAAVISCDPKSKRLVAPARARSTMAMTPTAMRRIGPLSQKRFAYANGRYKLTGRATEAAGDIRGRAELTKPEITRTRDQRSFG